MDTFSTPHSASYIAQRPLEGADPAVAPPKRPRGRPPKTSDERDDGNRRQALLSAAAKLFRTQGFDATTTRDIAAAVGMHSGSPFYHFKSKGDLLFAVMEEGMRAAIARQSTALDALNSAAPMLLNSELSTPVQTVQKALLAALVRNHLDILLGPDADFIPVMLYEWRSLNPRQRKQITLIKDEYEAVWTPVLLALHAAGRLGCEVKLARLMIFGALNWTAQWYDPRKVTQGGASLDDLATAAIALFLNKDSA
jgi:AcrR family transcriptional regulator